MSAEGKDGRGPQDKPAPPARGEMAPEDRDAMKRRSEDLGRKLDQARHRDVAGQVQMSGGKSKGEAMGRAMRVSAELIGGIVVGSAIGWFLDRWLGLDKPWFFILFFLLGAAAGILNVVRMAMRDKTPPLPSVADERDEDK